MSAKRLLTAAADWETDVVARLIAADPEVARATDERGRTPLHRCAGRSALGRDPAPSIRIASLLVAAGADLHAVEPIADGDEVFPARPVWYAVGRGRNPRLARWLLERGANGDHCLFAAVYAGDVAVTRLLLRHGSKPDLLGHGDTALVYAVCLGRLDQVAALLAGGAAVDARGRDGRTALWHAVKRKVDVKIARALIVAGASPDAADAEGTTPAALAARQRPPRLAELLAGRGSTRRRTGR